MKHTTRQLTLTGRFEFTCAFLGVAFNFLYIPIVLLYVHTSAPAQIANGEVFEREDLGSIPGLNIFLFSNFFIPDPTYFITQRSSYILRSHRQIYLQSYPMHQDCIHIVHPLKTATRNPMQDNLANQVGLSKFQILTPNILTTSPSFLFLFFCFI